MAAVHDGFVAVTPVHLDLTHHRALGPDDGLVERTQRAKLKRPRDRTP